MADPVPDVELDDGVEIPQLGFGVFQVPAEDTERVVAQALETGYRHFDTAAAYQNEEGVGRALAASGLDRDEVFVTTKLWNSQQGYESALQALPKSLERLGMAFVDLYLIHWPAPALNRYVETWRGFEKLKAGGLTRSIGVSNFNSHHIERLIEETDTAPSVNQVELHVTFSQPELRAYNREHDIATEAWSPLGQGRELGLPEIVAIAEAHGRTPAQVILRWHLQIGNIVFPKSVTPERMRENFDVFDFELSDDDLAAIAGLDRGERGGPDPDEFSMA
jgi:2,5-diketo-D-gluconate reductase A